MPYIPIRDVSLYIKVLGAGYPLVLMHGGPGSDHSTMLPLRRLADQFTLVFYDHRCNGRSVGVPISSMTWDNLTADAEALRLTLGFDKWAVLGHSFGGMVALEFALRYPDSLSHLVLIDSCGDISWVQEKAPEALAERGYSAETVEFARRFYTGHIEPGEMGTAMMKLGKAFYHNPSLWQLAKDFFRGLRMKSRPEAFIYGHRQLLKGWTVMDRLAEIRVPTLVMAGDDDFQFPPEHQEELAAGIPNARLEIIEDAGHNTPTERTTELTDAVRRFMITADQEVAQYNSSIF